METVESYLRLHSISILVRGLEKRRLNVLEIIANNRTIVDLKDCLKASEAEIKDLKRKVVKFKFFSGKSQACLDAQFPFLLMKLQTRIVI